VLQFFLGLGSPEAGDPLPTIFHLTPVAGKPFAPRRRRAPGAAHPDVIVLGLVPTPVAGDPLHVVARGLLLRWFLGDWIRWFLGYDVRWLLTGIAGLSERFVDGTAWQNFQNARLRRRWRSLVGAGARSHEERRGGD